MPLRGLCLLALLLFPVSACAADPSAVLWTIVSGQCVPHEQLSHNPSPCAEVDLAPGAGFAILKDIRGNSQFLLIPTTRIGGIEDPAILAPDAPNYFAEAWQARSFVEDRLHTVLPRDAFALAINAVTGRTQNQLHIHIDCIRPDVRTILIANLDRVTEVWTPFPEPLAGHIYRAIRIDGDTLGTTNPFRILADANPGIDMGLHTLVLVGATFPDGKPGFVLLDDRANVPAGDRASGEELEDHSCALARKPDSR